LQKHKPGDVIKIVYQHRGQQIEKEITLEQSSSVTIADATAGNPTDANKTFRKAWLEAKSSSSY
jgi:predicted metalloprotease with PDZ domain